MCPLSTWTVFYTTCYLFPSFSLSLSRNAVVRFAFGDVSRCLSMSLLSLCLCVTQLRHFFSAANCGWGIASRGSLDRFIIIIIINYYCYYLEGKLACWSFESAMIFSGGVGLERVLKRRSSVFQVWWYSKAAVRKRGGVIGLISCDLIAPVLFVYWKGEGGWTWRIFFCDCECEDTKTKWWNRSRWIAVDVVVERVSRRMSFTKALKLPSSTTSRPRKSLLILKPGSMGILVCLHTYYALLLLFRFVRLRSLFRFHRFHSAAMCLMEFVCKASNSSRAHASWKCMPLVKDREGLGSLYT